MKRLSVELTVIMVAFVVLFSWMARPTEAQGPFAQTAPSLMLTAGGRTIAGPGIWTGDPQRISAFVNPPRPVCVTTHNLGVATATVRIDLEVGGSHTTDIRRDETRTLCVRDESDFVLYSCQEGQVCKVLWRVDVN